MTTSVGNGKVSIVIPCYNQGMVLRETTSPRLAELVTYIFAKPEMACYKLVRKTDEEVQRLRGRIEGIEASYSYRLRRGLFAPARLLRKLWRRAFH